MRRAVLCLGVLLFASASAIAQASSPATITPEELTPGMKGTAYTVFQGVTPEAMDVEVLGVLRNVAGPRSSIILVRLHGPKVEYTGVVAGMSGSPVYFNGKLAGALAFRIGEFSKEPIAGITPIREMLEISQADTTPGGQATPVTTPPSTPTKTASPGLPAGTAGFLNAMKPIETPLVFNGFSEEAVKAFAPQFAAAGIVPVMGTGGVSDVKQPEPLVPGSAVSAMLVRGDMDIAATCTVTWADADHLLACGHPLMQFGNIDLPMSKAQVLATLPSPANAFKIVNTTEPAGVFVQDRKTGILGVFNRDAKMIPVTLNIHNGTANKEFHYEVLNNPRISPVAVMATVFNALKGMNEYGEEITYRLRGRINVNGYPEVVLNDMFTPTDAGQPAAMIAAIGLGDRFGRIFDNPFSAADIRSVNLDFDLIRERRSAVLEAARTDLTEARPGQELQVEAVIRPYRGERIVKRIPIHIPASASKGPLRILVTDGGTLDRIRRGAAIFGKRLDLGSTIAQINREHGSNQLYVSLLEADPEAMIGDKVMPSLPLSVMNVMDGMRGTQEMVVLGESAVKQASADLDYVVSGVQVMNITVK